jgi:hypothetical protein
MKTEYENEARKSFTMLRFSELVFAVRLVSVRLKKLPFQYSNCTP